MRLNAMLHTILWGVFCACSWTWCIGMYLPRIMIERWGWPGFLVFAVPNVIGCAAMGYVVKSAARSREIGSRHGRAMIAFSIVTIAYHAFFLTWFFSLPLANIETSAAFEAGSTQWMMMKALPILLSLAVCGVAMRIIVLSDLVVLIAGLVTYAISLGVFQQVGIEGWKTIAWTGTQSTAMLTWTAPTIIFGFLLCPYLDATFHRAVQHSPSRHAFSVFGLMFLIMILMTCALWFVDRELIMRYLTLHIVVQSVFTVGAHAREICRSEHAGSRSMKTILCAAPLLAAFIWPIANYLSEQRVPFDDMYLRFLVFYGLFFPAYVLIFMGRGAISTSRRNLAVFAAITLFSLPAYELGFLHQRPWLLLPPAGVLLGWKFLSRHGNMKNAAHATS